MGTSREQRLSQAFVELAGTLVDDFDVVELLTTLSLHCVDLLGVRSSGVILADLEGNLHVIGASSEEGHELDIREIQSGQGPCLDCYRTGLIQYTADLDTETRWPLFAPAARVLGYRSIHALPLRLRGQVIGALNLMHTAPGRLPEDDLRTAQALADIATVGLFSHRQAVQPARFTDQLLTARTSRSHVERAVGIVAEHRRVDTATAFRALRERSRRDGVRMSELAHDITRGDFDVAALADLTDERDGRDHRETG
ncbi:GAF and ANTAR domain-containing protein [Streptomyces varsoviensis]|uniref:GAF and ANTAR domain-containing protein n=1 Tax=Streptomyces varsoviensis TaxID=67373 RepID=UPI00066227C0|nr:GAF and ANTAR domain-containing protein [Streptomyces varsoviensis]